MIAPPHERLFSRWTVPFHSACVAFVAGAGLVGARAETVRVFPSLGIEGARLRFHLGEVRDNAPAISPTLPEIPGSVSAWYIAQWRKRELLKPERMVRHDAAGVDPGLGTPAFSFPSTSGESRLDIFQQLGRPYVFGLTASGGPRSSEGGANLFLAADALGDGVGLTSPTTYRVKLKLTRASASAHDPNDLRNGTVLAQVFTGFTLRFTDPATGKVTPAFLQIHHADSRGQRPDYRQCSFANGTAQILIGGGLAADHFLPFRPSPGRAPLTPYTFDLNRHVCALVRAEFSCSGATGPHPFAFPAAAADLGNWRIRSIYVGLETQSSGVDLAAPPKGKVAVGLQVSDPEILQPESRPGASVTCAAYAEP